MKKLIPGGLFVSLEGIDGAGKSTLSKALAAMLEQNDYPVFLTREPGGTPLGMELRSLLLRSQDELVAQAGFLLFAADRAQHVSTVIKPQLARGYIVISDRFSDSSLAYQGYGKRLSLTMIQTVNEWAGQSCVPDLVLFLQISVKDALIRVNERKSEYSSFEKYDFLSRVSDGFEKIFKERNNVVYLNALEEHEQILTHSFNAVVRCLEKK